MDKQIGRAKESRRTTDFGCSCFRGMATVVVPRDNCVDDRKLADRRKVEDGNK